MPILGLRIKEFKPKNVMNIHLQFSLHVEVVHANYQMVLQFALISVHALIVMQHIELIILKPLMLFGQMNIL